MVDRHAAVGKRWFIGGFIIDICFGDYFWRFAKSPATSNDRIYAAKQVQSHSRVGFNPHMTSAVVSRVTEAFVIEIYDLLHERAVDVFRSLIATPGFLDKFPQCYVLSHYYSIATRRV